MEDSFFGQRETGAKRVAIVCFNYCLISNREGLSTSLKIMGLAAIDSHSQKEHTEIHRQELHASPHLEHIPMLSYPYISIYRTS